MINLFKLRSGDNLGISKYFISLILSSFIFPVWGQENTHTFLKFSPDAYSQSIGGPNAAYSIGAIDVFINPALLTNHSQLEFQFSNLINSNYLQYINAALKIPLTSSDFIGIGFFSLNIPIIKYYNNELLDISKYQNYLFNFTLGYAHKLSHLSFGITLKYYQFDFNDEGKYSNVQSLEIDSGIHFMIRKYLNIGFVYKNFISDMSYTESSNLDTDHLAFGIALNPSLISKRNLNLLIGMDNIEDGSVQINYGVVFTPYKNNSGITKVNFRAGLGDFDLEYRKLKKNIVQMFAKNRTLKIGFGIGISPIKSWELNLDYCFQYDKILENKHIITTRFRF
jgi:hypothetical protein